MLKGSQKENKDLIFEIERMTKSHNKQDELIKKQQYELSQLKKEEIRETFQDNNVLEVNLHYEETIQRLEEEIENLKVENDNYANNEMVKLENALNAQKTEADKNLKELGYYEERCNLLEKQNNELKNRVHTLKQGTN